MAGLADIISQHASEIEKFLVQTESMFLVRLDRNLRIRACTPYLRRLVSPEKNLTGWPFLSFLMPESKNILPLDNGCVETPPLRIIFLSFDGIPAPLVCQIFRTEGDHYLILGGKHMVTHKDVLEKMTLMSNELNNMARDLKRKNRELAAAQRQIKTLSGIVPICMHCKGIRDDKGYWNQLEKYLSEHSEARFSHGICDDCMEKYYPDINLSDEQG